MVMLMVEVMVVVEEAAAVKTTGATPFLINPRTDGETVSLSKQALSPLHSSSQTLL